MSNAAEAAATGSPATGFNKAAVVLLGAIGGIQVTDPIIASTALVNSAADLQFSAAVMSLAAGISTLALAATVIPGGLIADRLGRRTVLFWALLISAVGQLVTAFAPTTSVFLLGRVVAGIALGVVFGASYGLLRNVAMNSLGPAMGLYNVMNIVIALSFGVAGGSLASLNWRYSYMLLPVLSVICAFLLRSIVPKAGKLPGGKIDYIGMVLVGVGVVGILYGVSKAALSPSSPACWGPILLGIVAFILFGVVETKSSHPIFPIRLLTHPAFLAAIILGIAWNMGNGAMVQMIANIWQYVQNYDTVQVSFYQLFMSFAAIVGSLIAGRMLGKGHLPRTLGFTGLILLAAGFLLLLFVSPTSGLLIFLPGMLFAGFGWMMDATTQGAMFLTLAPAKYFGPVTSSKVTVGQFGYSLGLSGSARQPVHHQLR